MLGGMFSSEQMDVRVTGNITCIEKKSPYNFTE